MSNKESNIEKTNFDAFIQAVGSEIEQAQVRLIVAANAQMLFHYWKIGNYILYHQQLHGWGSKIIKQLAKAIRLHYPEKKGYSERNLTYMCQFAKAYPLRALQSFIETDASLSVPTIQSVTNEVLKLNDKQFTQELTAQIQSIDCQSLAITQEVPAQFEDVGKTVSAIYRMGIREIEEVFLTSPIAKINWTSQMTILDSSLPLGLSYWYMKQSVEMGWSSNVLKMQIDSDLYSRQISNNKVNNFTTTLPAPQSDLANYLLKDPYIFDLAGAKEKADERDIEEQLVKHVTRYLLEMGNGFAFVARQKHFQVGNSDFFADLILYSIPLHAYIVIELKATPFKPEYAGQLNFYINVVDDKLRGEHDNKTIGLLLCRGKDEVVAQYALSGYDQPIGISDYQLSKAIPEKLKSALPSVEEVEEELASLIDEILSRIPASEKKLTVKVNGSDLQIPFKTIVHADHFSHMIHIHTTKEKELVIRQSFGTFTAPLKEDSRFFICNRGTIINMEHAVDFDGTMFLLDDGSKIVVSRELCKPARQHFMDYLFQKGGF